MMTVHRAAIRNLPLAVIALLPFASPDQVRAYSVLTHQALVDTLWDESIKVVLLKRFPEATEEDLRVARGYAYGGCIIQDLGYYPFGSRFFSDLLHYVRSADFLPVMLEESRDLNEYAFALGAVSHYGADVEGHSLGVKLEDIFPRLDRALETYRFSVRTLIPEMTKVAWAAKSAEIMGRQPGVSRKQFLFNVSRAKYEE